MIAGCIGVDSVRIWCNHDALAYAGLDYSLAYGWPNGQKDDDDHVRHLDGAAFDWIPLLRGNKIVNFNAEDIEARDSSMLDLEGLKSILVIPVFIQDAFWGFVSFEDYTHDRHFTLSECDLMRSASFLLVNASIRQSILQDLVDAREEAYSNSRAKGEFLANMSHEIRTPLNAIIGMTKLAQETEDAERKEYCLGKIKEASSHLLGVINDILDMSKIEANKLEVFPVPFHIRAMIDRVVSIMRFRLDEKQLEFTSEVCPDVPNVAIGDDQRLAQVITNLLSNAVKFTPSEGRIRLSVRLLERSAEACVVEVSVADTGIGISQEQQTRLFSSFEQADSSTSRKYGGTGLGLAISRRIIEMMHGTIAVRSVPGEGSTFSFTVKLRLVANGNAETGVDNGRDFSIYETASRRDTAAEQGRIPDFGAYAVLLAEDMEINREILTSLLEPTKLRVDCAVNGREALECYLAKDGAYDLVFMDLQMPEMNGYDAAVAIRKSGMPSAEGIPIIAMTANVFHEDIERCFACGMNGHIGKPIDFTQVIEALNQYLLPTPD
jgi:signal transduction histidine kinase